MQAEEASRSDGTALERSDDLESTTIEASGQSYVALKGKNSSVDFTATTAANALDLRFTLPDHKSGQVQVYINNDLAATLTLSSETAWQYVYKESIYDEPTLAPGTAYKSFRFDEVHTLLNGQIQQGDHVRIVKVDQNDTEYGIDFIELEQAAPAIERPEGAVRIADYNGAQPGDGVADDAALAAAMDAAARRAAKKEVARIERKLERLWAEASSLEAKLEKLSIQVATDPSAVSELTKVSAAHQDVLSEMDELEEAWLEAADLLE